MKSQQEATPTFNDLRTDNNKRMAELMSLAQNEDIKATETTELSIREAIERFAKGVTTTDGSWTATNLVKEADVPRPTLYRYKKELKLFRSLGEVAPKSGMREEMKRLRSELADLKSEGIAERKRHRATEAVLVERIHALSLIVAAGAGDTSLPSILMPQQRAKTN